MRKLPKSIVIYLFLVVALLLADIFIFRPITPPAQPDTAAVEQQIQQLKADIADTQAEIDALKQSHSLMLGVTEDLDNRIAGVEGRRR